MKLKNLKKKIRRLEARLRDGPKKLAKLKSRLATAKEGRERDTVLAKIKLISPWWKPAAAES